MEVKGMPTKNASGSIMGLPAIILNPSPPPGIQDPSGYTKNSAQLVT